MPVASRVLWKYGRLLLLEETRSALVGCQQKSVVQAVPGVSPSNANLRQRRQETAHKNTPYHEAAHRIASH